MDASCKKSMWLPTAALSASGDRVEVRLLPLSLHLQAPLYLFQLLFYTLFCLNTSSFSKESTFIAQDSGAGICKCFAERRWYSCWRVVQLFDAYKAEWKQLVYRSYRNTVQYCRWEHCKGSTHPRKGDDGMDELFRPPRQYSEKRVYRNGGRCCGIGRRVVLAQLFIGWLESR